MLSAVLQICQQYSHEMLAWLRTATRAVLCIYCYLFIYLCYSLHHTTAATLSRYWNLLNKPTQFGHCMNAVTRLYTIRDNFIFRGSSFWRNNLMTEIIPAAEYLLLFITGFGLATKPGPLLRRFGGSSSTDRRWWLIEDISAWNVSIEAARFPFHPCSQHGDETSPLLFVSDHPT